MLRTKQATLGDGILSSEGEGMDIQLAGVAVSPLHTKLIHSGDIRVHSYFLVKVYRTTFGARGAFCSSQRF
jgi:hypothetical protein